MLPVKTRILQYAIECGQPFTVNDVCQVIQSEYPGEAKLTSRKMIEEYIASFVGVNFLSASNLHFDENGQLSSDYQITDYGKSRQKYMH